MGTFLYIPQAKSIKTVMIRFTDNETDACLCVTENKGFSESSEVVKTQLR